MQRFLCIFRLYELTSVKKDLHLQVGVCCDLRSSGQKQGTNCRGCVVALGPGGGRVGRENMASHWLRLLGSMTLTAAWSLVNTAGVCNGYKHSWGLQWHLQAKWLGIRTGSGGGQSWRYAHTQLWGPAAAACVVAGSGCRHTHDKRQDQQKEPEPTIDTLAVTKDLAVSVHSHGCRVSPWVHIWPWKLMTRVRSGACMCAAGGASPVCTWPWGSSHRV